MRRKILYTLAFAVLVAIAAVLMVSNRNSTLQKRNMNFTLVEPSLVDKIVIRNNTGRLVIEKAGDGWQLNAKYPATTQTVTQFLQAMGRIEILSPASKSMRDSLARRIDERGTSLKLYHRNRTLLSIGIVYAKGPIPGTYMMDERFREPFRVGLTGYNGDNFAGLFSPVISRWKDNVLLDYRPEDIAIIRMEYPEDPGQSFVLTVNRGQAPRLDPVSASVAPGNADLQEIADYLTGFSGIRYGVPDSSLYDATSLKEPFALLTLTDRTQHVFSMKAFRMTVPGKTGYDVRRYLVIQAGDSQPLMVNYSDTDPIMKSYRDFLKK